ncbi:hypothetical protein B9479_007057 [Cryptococcus floricola]|uniref:LisH domain-containing protein n=1 Tax=Cryptococcus floricola TaxID=2591691 RepID=A0A5D3ANR4_9TREE|nr:hypothetical protein B9479_007057 [Cryptococcus floricola]
MLPPDPPKLSHRDIHPTEDLYDDDVDINSDTENTVELSSTEINILIYLYLLESNFTHTAFTLLSESNLPSTTLFQHFNPSYPTPSSSSSAATSKTTRLAARAKDKDPSHPAHPAHHRPDSSPSAPAFGRAGGRIERGELVRKLWKAVRWEEVERHVGSGGAGGEVGGEGQCQGKFRLLVPHVCPQGFQAGGTGAGEVGGVGVGVGEAPPPKRPEVFPAPEEREKKAKKKTRRPSSSPPPRDRDRERDRDRSFSPPPKDSKKPAQESKKEKPRKRARLSDAEDSEPAPPKVKRKEKEKEKEKEGGLKVPTTSASAQASRATTPGERERERERESRPNSKGKEKEPKKVELGEEVSSVAWNPKNVDLLASGSNDGFVRLWEFLPPPPPPPPSSSSLPPNPNPSLTLPTRPTGISHKGIDTSKKTITAVAWHPDGTILATGSQDGVGRLFTPGGQLQAIMSYGRGAVNAIKWAPGGMAILVGKDDFTVCMWVERGGSMVMKMCFDAHTKEVNDVDWLDDDVFASAGNDHTILVHYADDKRPRFTFKGHTDDVTKIKWSPRVPGPAQGKQGGVGERLLASVADDGSCMIWRLPWYPSGRGGSVAAGGGGGGQGRGEGAFGPTGRSISPVKKHDALSDEDDYFHPSQSHSQSQSNTPLPGSNSGKGGTGVDNCLHRLNVVSGSENKRMDQLEWMPANESGRLILAAGGQDATVKLFDALSGETLHVLSGLESGTGSLAFSPRAFLGLEGVRGRGKGEGRGEGKVGRLGVLAGGGGDGVVRVWDVESGRVIWGMEVEEDEKKRDIRERPMMLSMGWREDGKHLACGLFNKTLYMVNVMKAIGGREKESK